VSDILADRILLDLIERLETTRVALDTTAFHVEPTEFYAVAASTARTLREAIGYLAHLRQERLAATAGGDGLSRQSSAKSA